MTMDSSEQSQMERQHIFVVNGSADFLDLVRELLQEENYNVTTTNFVPKTFDQIAALNPSLLVIDLAVGVRAGWDLLARLGTEASTRGTPIIVVSTDRRMLQAAEASLEGDGPKRYIEKPLDIDDLLGLVEDLIGSA
jgi:CheY-like chemotaxis protein